MMWYYGGGWGEWLMFLGMIVFLAAVVVAVVFALRGLSFGARGGAGRSSDGPSAKDILKRRYAAGEVDHEDYLQRLHDLES